MSAIPKFQFILFVFVCSFASLAPLKDRKEKKNPILIRCDLFLLAHIVSRVRKHKLE